MMRILFPEHLRFLCFMAVLGLLLTDVSIVFAQSLRGTYQRPEPEDLIIYQIFLDRFENGSTANDDGNPRASFSPSAPRGFHGGDIEGIRQQLPYIKALGANGIWMTPFVENVDSYHGYGAYDWYNVDPNFGTLAELKQLVEEAHDLGIAVFYDMVAGHMGDQITSSDGGYPGYRSPPGEYTLRWRSSLRYPPPFDSLEYFHGHGHIGNYTQPEEVLGELAGLDDLKTETSYVRQQMLAIWSHWLTETGADGFRVDTVKHIDLGFWAEFLPALRQAARDNGIGELYIFGEIYGADDGFMRNYVGTLNSSPYKFDAAVDFQFYYSAGGVFARANTAPSSIASRLENRANNLPGHNLKMPNFLDNHDVRRFLSTSQDNPGRGSAEQIRRLELGLIFLMTAPGPPIIYYGTEQGFNGGEDPYNREDMFDGLFESGPSEGDNFDTSSPLFGLTARLAQLRQALTPLRRGAFERRFDASNGPGILAYTRTHNSESVYTIINTSTSPQTAPAALIPGFASTTLVDALNPASQLVIDESGNVPARTLVGQGAEIWIPSGALPPLKPEVIAFAPADEQTRVPVDLPTITIQFLTPMDTVVTEAAISVSPTLSFLSQWSDDSRTITLVLDESLTAQTVYTVIVGPDAESSGGETIGYETSASWMTDRGSLELPPLPPAYPPLPPRNTAITINANPSDWPALDGVGNDMGIVSPENAFLYRDSIGDDVGPSSYAYPTNPVFTGADADLEEFRLAYDDSYVYMLLKVVSVNPSASFFTPYIGVAVDLGPGGQLEPLGHHQQDGAIGITELLVRPDVAPEFEIVFTGPRGATLLDHTTMSITALDASHGSTGFVELRVPRSLLGLDAPMNRQQFNVVVYTALEVYGGVREVAPSVGSWEPGGGLTSPADPDVFDLAGAGLADQMTDLADYDDVFYSTILHSILPLRLNEVTGDDGSIWMIY